MYKKLLICIISILLAAAWGSFLPTYAAELSGTLQFYKEKDGVLQPISKATAENGTIGKINTYLPLTESESAFLALAVYDTDGALLSVSTDRANAGKNQMLCASQDIGAAQKLKGFVFDGADCITPLIYPEISPVSVSYTDAATVVLEWSASDFPGADKYLISRNGTVIGETESCRFIDGYLDSNTLYAYTVSSCHDINRSCSITTVTSTANSAIFRAEGAEGTLTFLDNHTNDKGDSYTEPAYIGGRYCRKSIQIPKNSPTRVGMMYFTAKRHLIPSSAKHVTFDVTYFDNGTDNIFVEYNTATVLAKKELLVKRTGTNTWKTARLCVNDASLRSPAALQSSDFRINGGAETYISKVSAEQTQYALSRAVYAKLDDSGYSESCGLTVSGSAAPSFRIDNTVLKNSGENLVVSIKTDGLEESAALVCSGEVIPITPYTNGNYTVVLGAEHINDSFSLTLNGGSALRYFSVGNACPQYAVSNLGGSISEHGIKFSLAAGDATTSAAEIGGRSCRKAERDSVNNKDRYMYFNVDDRYAFGEKDKDITIDISYFDYGRKTLNIQYNTAASDYKSIPIVTLTDSREWKTASITLRDACFTNSQNYNNDFRIGNSDVLYVSSVAVRVNTTTAPDRSAPPQIFLASDSTCENLPAVYAPREGWGMEIGQFFMPTVQIVNKAKGGKSSRTFLNGMDPTANPIIENDGRMEEILSLAQPGDYLFIQFGHNDRSTSRPVQQTDPHSTEQNETSYRYNLTRFINIARENDIIPIFITSINERKFSGSSDVMLDDGIEAYRTAMREVGAAYNVPVLDIAPAHKALVERWGNEGSKKLYLHFTKTDYPSYPANLPDNTHISKTGAVEVAKLVASAIKNGASEYSELARLAALLNPSADLSPAEPY